LVALPISYSIDQGLVIAKVDGAADLADVRAYLSTMRSDPAYHGVIGSLIDCRTVTNLLSTEELRTIAKERKSATTSSPRARTAMLAGSDVVFGVLRMYEAFSDGSNVVVRVFRNETEARSWLLTGRKGP
jgi:hypothetical protein